MVRRLPLSAIGALLAIVYALALLFAPRGVYVVVHMEDHAGAPIELEDGWGRALDAGDWANGPPAGMVVSGTDDMLDWRRQWRMPRRPLIGLRGQQRVVFRCRPGAEAAFACMTHLHGTDAVVLELPDVSPWFPWGLGFVTLRPPGSPKDTQGALALTVLDPSGTVSKGYPDVALVSPVARIGLVREFRSSRLHRVKERAVPFERDLPAGQYRVEIAQHFPVMCANGTPRMDWHVDPDVLAMVEPGARTEATITREGGVHLDLKITVNGAKDDFGERVEAMVHQLERGGVLLGEPSDTSLLADADLLSLDEFGHPVGRPTRFSCRWDGCHFIGARTTFPLLPRIEGLAQYRSGCYRICITGPGIEPFQLDVDTAGARPAEGFNPWDASGPRLTVPVVLQLRRAR